MNHKKTFRSSALAALLASLALGALPALAETNVHANVDVSVRASTTERGKLAANTDARMGQSKARANEEIARRVAALNELLTRINSMKHLSSDEKTSLSATIQSQLKLMADLKAKISADTTADALKTDIKSITSSYRIFALIIPKGHIEAAADKVLDIVGLTADLSAKLKAKIDAAETAGKSVETLRSALTDMNAKSADAKIQANAAIDLIANLTPDMGDKTKMESNKQALMAARAKISAAGKDLDAMRKDAKMIIASLNSFHLNAQGKISATTSESDN